MIISIDKREYLIKCHVIYIFKIKLSIQELWPDALSTKTNKNTFSSEILKNFLKDWAKKIGNHYVIQCFIEVLFSAIQPEKNVRHKNWKGKSKIVIIHKWHEYVLW